MIMTIGDREKAVAEITKNLTNGDKLLMRKKIDIDNEELKTDTLPEENSGDEPSSEASASNEGAEAYIVALQADLDDARTKLEEADKRVLYVQAEFQNFRRRKDDEFKELQKFTNRELLMSILPVVDSFERALAAAEQTQNLESLMGGLAGTLKQLQSVLTKSGVTPIESLGKEFNPQFHEAIGHTESDEYPANTVAEEVQRGYTMQDRVLRPALVKVTEG